MADRRKNKAEKEGSRKKPVGDNRGAGKIYDLSRFLTEIPVDSFFSEKIDGSNCVVMHMKLFCKITGMDPKNVERYCLFGTQWMILAKQEFFIRGFDGEKQAIWATKAKNPRYAADFIKAGGILEGWYPLYDYEKLVALDEWERMKTSPHITLHVPVDVNGKFDDLAEGFVHFVTAFKHAFGAGLFEILDKHDMEYLSCEAVGKVMKKPEWILQNTNETYLIPHFGTEIRIPSELITPEGIPKVLHALSHTEGIVAAISSDQLYKMRLDMLEVNGKRCAPALNQSLDFMKLTDGVSHYELSILYPDSPYMKLDKELVIYEANIGANIGANIEGHKIQQVILPLPMVLERAKSITWRGAKMTHPYELVDL